MSVHCGAVASQKLTRPEVIKPPLYCTVAVSVITVPEATVVTSERCRCWRRSGCNGNAGIPCKDAKEHESGFTRKSAQR
jgi:hypothetical protein